MTAGDGSSLMIRQMESDTRIEKRNGHWYAVVAAPLVPESDVAFHMDREWQEWFRNTYRRFDIHEMRDSNDPSESWVVELRVR